MVVIDPAPVAAGGLSVERRTVVIARGTFVGMFGAICLINLCAFFAEASPLPFTHLSAAILALYLLSEALRYLRRSDAIGLMSPAFLALIFHFMSSYLMGITVSVFFPSEGMLRFAVWLPSLDNALSSTLILAGFAAFCMMRGYVIGQPLARMLRRSVEATPLLRRDLRLAFSLVLGVQIFYVLLVFYAINRGVYGLLSTAETRERYLDLVQFLNLALAAGTLSYFLILLRYFVRRAAGRASSFETVGIGALIALQVILGAMSIFKSQIVLPFLIGGLAYFLVNRRVPMQFIAYSCIALGVSYLVIEPFRSYLNLSDTQPASVTEVVNTAFLSFELRDQLATGNELSLLEAITYRIDLTGMTALALDYVDRGHLTDEMRAEFQDSILLAPILAYVPRAVWRDKPIYAPGTWFNQNVQGRQNDLSTSVAMGPIGYLYMAGGLIAVALGFLGFGIFQALIFDGFARAGPGGIIVFFCVAGPLVTIPSSYGPAVTGMLRILPIAFIIQMIFLRKGVSPGNKL